MGWTLTAVAARAAGVLGGETRWTAPAALEQARALARRGGPDAFARAFIRRRDAASAADRKALDAARATAGGDAGVIDRAVASGAPLDAVAALASRWPDLPRDARGMVRNPLGRASTGPVTWGSVRAVQVDQTTCGAAVMSMMAMMTDPFVALWVATGGTAADYLPPEALAVTVRNRPANTVDERWRALQRTFHEATTRTAVGPLPWPRSLGTPPWRVDNVTRCAGLRFRGVVVDDANTAQIGALATHAAAALADGIPVPLYSGGDSSMGLEGVVPRHVVLLTGHGDGSFRIYEPSSGAVHALAAADLGPPHRRLAALGNWSRVCWAVLPRQVQT